MEQSAQANPNRADVQVELAEIYCTRGEIEMADGQPEKARAWYEKAQTIRKQRTVADPTDEPSIAFCADSLSASAPPSRPLAGRPTR